MVALLNEQSWRTDVWGFLSDGIIIQFFHLHRPNGISIGDDPVKFHECQVVQLVGEGAALLVKMHSVNPEELGFKPMKLCVTSTASQQKTNVVELTHLLGKGASAEVYQFLLDDQPTLAKIFKSPQANDEARKKLCQAESDMLSHLQERCPELVASGRVTSVVTGYSAALDQKDPSYVLLLRPVGLQFACTAQEHLRASEPDLWGQSFYTPVFSCWGDNLSEAVSIIKTVHSAGLLHRDLTLGNIFRKTDSVLPLPAVSASSSSTSSSSELATAHIAIQPVAPSSPSSATASTSEKKTSTFVNDWGCAIKQHNSEIFQGSTEHASFRILEKLLMARDIRIESKPEDDLHSLVCCAFHATCPLQYDLYLRPNRTVHSIIVFWNRVAACEPWKTLFAMAAACNYDGLAKAFRKIVPIFPPLFGAVPTLRTISERDEDQEDHTTRRAKRSSAYS